MNKSFEKFLERLEEKLKKSEERYHRYLDDSNLSCMFDKSDIEETRIDTIKEMLEIVQEVAEEYNTDLYSYAYNKAIDDFVKALCIEYSPVSDEMQNEYDSVCSRFEKIAEQLKAGGENENYNKEES